ncbi:MAG: glycosyltransferase family 4 protein [Sphingomonadaceae bacterium]|nr:glycosyltransferase family 4 protein [Sphingomonadaceae bacterium]MDW8323017.1 glycosyltransferase family 4 protein [Burkholderiales bacterium]
MPERLTVVQVLPALESGGVERGTLELARHLVELGHRSIVISAGGRMVESLIRAGSEHLSWDVGHKGLTTLRYVPRLRRYLRAQAVDILHARSRMPAWVAYLAWRGMDPIARPRFVTTVHGLYSVNPYSAVMVKGERVIAVSAAVRDYILRAYPRTDPARIRLIPRGIDPAHHPPGYRPPPAWLAAWQAQYPQLAGKRLITLPGRITRLKGHEDFIALVSRLKALGEPVHGLIVGGVHPRKRRYLDELRARIAAAGLERDISFTGARDDLREIMAVSDLVLSLSAQPESFGRTVLEALALGVPVAGYDHGGVGEQLRRHYPQGCVPLRDLDALVQVCLGLLHTPPPVDVRGLPTLAAMLAATVDLYRELLSASPATGR